MNKMDALRAKRRQDRLAIAAVATSQIVSAASENGIDIAVIGSLARGDFGLHSDVDLLVRGQPDALRRRLVEKLVADALRPSAIPYDLIFEADLAPDRVQEFLHGAV